MSWQEMITPGPVWSGVEEYAGERIAALTAVCTDPDASDLQIRAAQAGIAEMRALVALPDQIKTLSAQLESAPKRRTGY